MKYIAPIDPHVHLRGNEYSETFLRWGFEDARKVGLAGLIEQPNPQPWLTSEESVANRRNSVQKLAFADIAHSVHIGLTNDPNQVEAALGLVMRGGVASDKIFYTHSTGNMGILDPDFQMWIWRKKREMGYRGVSIGHFEDELEYTVPFDPLNPVTHSWRQNPEAEYIQVERQLRNADLTAFRGTFYIAHVSNPATIDLVRSRNWAFRIATEASFHHMFLRHEDYLTHGNRVKMNPPLRSQRMQELLLEYVLAGYITLIGTDHAPHPIAKKDDKGKPASGIPALPFWPEGIRILRKLGIEEDLLERMIFCEANRLFRLNLQKREVEVTYDPSLWEKYGFNPFSRISAN